MGKISVIEFERQFKALYRPLCLFAMRYLERMEDAEDVVQQAFADVWEKNAEGAAILNLKAYLYQAVRNRSLTLLQQSPELESADALPDREDPTVDEDILRAERDARLWQAIDDLPTERRRIFLLSKRDGLKYQEIADELHISIKTVENQMSKALKSLRETAHRIYLFFFS
ncbi:RNA polymerase sigma-70 factor (family 1) [Parabacteroides sp. PFB2-12]|uniref:RNA polymerase sigma-70 factor n=1 Tax=unclassified Parabacteroides TaxID=2649774 RepID=UPI002474BB64|nr:MULTISPECIES: RNA polymerase sigma-70 factor [unclassified Parabacteroides]MDH6343863.1 RNA polymerase sigma-70 factor (family 1) [Parabacteroides sp. PM6-13]MDH6391225.1 RNA polymerase sigma-70 factor (family 1) [Parabacteroides sp. PFB2-12]